MLTRWNMATRLRKRPQMEPHIEHASPLAPQSEIGGYYNTVWAGYEVTYDDNPVYFTKASAYWTVPAIYQGGYVIGSWVGLGGDALTNKNPIGNVRPFVLWQAGVASYADPQYHFFYQDAGCAGDSPAPCPNGGDVVPIQNPPVNPGDLVYASVDAQQGTYLLADYTTNRSTGLQIVSIDNNNTGASAEFILEEAPCPTGNDDRHPCNGGGPFTDPNFYQAQATGNSQARYVDGWNYEPVTACTNRVSSSQSYTLAQPGSVNTNHGFSVIYGFQPIPGTQLINCG